VSDIFISYASADRDRAKVIAEALAARGFSVWWDRVIPPGRQFDEVIEEALDASRCVVVLWSKTSVGSTWVKTEAAEAMSRKALIPAIIEEVRIPLEFRRLQAADLSRWTGDPNDPQLEQFFTSIESELARNPDGPREEPRRVEPPPPPPVTPPAAKARKLSPALIGTVVAAIVVLIAAGYYYEQSKNAALAEQAERMRASQEAERIAREDAEKTRRADDERKAAEQRRANEARSSSPPPAAASRPNTSQQGRTAQAVPASGTVNVKWRDHALSYSGTLAWNPSSALLQVSVVDLQTGRPIGNYNVPAAVAQVAPTDYVVSAQFAVPGDSATPGPHTHMSRLLFKAQPDGSIRLMQNCPRPGECY
jgi:hypothetical protein